MELLSLWWLCEGNLEGGLLYWRPRRTCKGGLWKRHPPQGPLEGPGGGCCFTGDFERKVRF